MLLKDIVKNINKLVSNNSSFALTYNQLVLYINSAVDYIDSILRTDYVTPDEDWEDNKTEYNIIYNTDHYKGEFSTAPTTGMTTDDTYYNTTDKKYYVYYSSSWNEVTDDNLSHITDLVISNTNYDYKEITDDMIRNVLIYYTAASYLEEEDEFESQYKRYLSKAEEYILYIRDTYYSCLDSWW